MVIPSFTAKGGITSVANGYLESKLNDKYDISYIETYCDGWRFQKILKALKAYFCFLFIILFKKPDIVHIHSSFGASFYRKAPFVFLASKVNLFIINHVHGADFNEFFVNVNKNRKKRIESLYKKCDVTIALSDEWKENLSKIVEKEKIEIIENYSILQHNIKFDREEKRVLFLGFLCERKGCFDIPEVIYRVRQSITDVKFVLAGSGDKEDMNLIKRYIERYDISAYCEFPGWVRGREKEELLSQASLFFLPSYNEGMPMAILDAMGYGLPIVSTSVGGIEKIVHNGENGFVFGPGDIEGFAKAIIKILSNDEYRKFLGNGSINIVRNGYSLEAHIQKVIEVYDKKR
ncbi:glycosyltransferase family 4 protein [Acetobacterium wieringae]|uniref:glycosyltransferase family 4 protein n=1 Tax=Acetobacterium wieringae TaxID=52694 RepID=UPI002033E089|nr:glycosyltransferase family 4 protein [Acetobacterium wieringae]URN84120.1 glycosyltransferase family 4 protein [Acetobacterium wieringae]